MMKEFIINQIVVDNTSAKGNTHNILVSVIVRRVKAETKEEAIGKFVLATADIKVQQKLNIECIPYENLTSID